MSWFYKAAYGIGVKPWEEMASLPIGAQIISLIEREEKERHPSYGALLDLGCGCGICLTKLAARAWTVTGIDIVSKALRAARRRIAEAGMDARLVEGDPTALRAAGVGSGFRSSLDLGAIHAPGDTQRASEAREVNAVAASKCDQAADMTGAPAFDKKGRISLLQTAAGMSSVFRRC